MKIFLSLFFLLPLSALAQEGPKAKPSLFNPVPKDRMREMETDRPNITESPFTIDAGHFQYEADIVKYETQNTEVGSQRLFMLNQANLKVGVSSSTSLQLMFQSFGVQTDRDAVSGQKTTSRGIGDLKLRIKQNLIGNDGGKFAVALLPYIGFPTSTIEESRYEAGLLVPMQLKLPGDWELGMQIEGDRLKDDDQDAMHTEFQHSLVISHDIIKGLRGSAETYYSYDFKKHHWQNYLDAGLQLEVSDHFKIDGGLNYGIQSDAERNYFLGAAFRF